MDGLIGKKSDELMDGQIFGWVDEWIDLQIF